MSATAKQTTVLLSAIGAAIFLAAWTPVDGDDDELTRKLDALTARVETIEKTLGSRADDASKASLVERVAGLEKGLGELARAAGKPQWSSPERNLRELQRSLESAERQRVEIANRLNRLERDLRDATAFGRELRTVKFQLDSARRSLRDLENRVRRLE